MNKKIKSIIFRKSVSGLVFGIAFTLGMFGTMLLAVSVTNKISSSSYSVANIQSNKTIKASDISTNFEAIKTNLTDLNTIVESLQMDSSGRPIRTNGASSSTIIGTYCGISSNTTGSFSYGGQTGFKAAKLICENTCSNTKAHMCSLLETQLSQQLGISVSGGWVLGGSIVNGITTNCQGWTDGGGTYQGYTGGGYINGVSYCNSATGIMCCL